MRGHGAVLTTWLVLAGCAPAVVEDAELGRICGQDGPVRILALEADEMPAGFGRAMAKSGDRLYYMIGDAVTEADAPFGDSEYSAAFPKPGHPRVWSSGTCGESPKPIAEDVQTVFTDRRWPGAVLALGKDGDVMKLDPEGGPPRLFFPVLPSSTSTDVGMVGIVRSESSAEAGRVVFQPYPASADAPVPAQIELEIEAPAQSSALQGVGHEVFVTDTQGRLQVVDLDSLEVEILRDDVILATVSTDGRIVVMKTTMVGAVDGARRVIALDRDTGVETVLGEVDEYWYPFASGEFIELELAPTGRRLFTFPSLTAYDLPADIRLSSEISEGLYLATQGDQRVTYELATGETVVVGGAFDSYQVVDDGVLVLDLQPDLRDVGLFRKSAPMHHVPFSGGSRELVAERAALTRLTLPDGRILTPVGVGTDYLGELVVVEPDTLDEQRIDTHVVAVDVNLADSFIATDAPIFDEGVIAYGVRDGDRSGIWLAKPE